MSIPVVSTNLSRILQKNARDFHPIIKFDAGREKFFRFDFSEKSKLIPAKETIAETFSFAEWVNDTLISHNATYGIGGYNEDRVLYRRSELFGGEEARSIHLGIDIWGPAGTSVYAPLGGMVHSYAFNDQFGDYGATIILLHQLETISFYTLYGHLSLGDLSKVQAGAYISRGQVVGHFGRPEENGHWPPHLHFQVIEDLQLKEGDYPGVCKPSEAAYYLMNCPDPAPLLGFTPNV
ncbi:MAG: peptidoglycan DD-metalloendopeptidase family protein [Ferruginibacter sp.]